jgi:3-hydroxybutyryl-CoA dehydrogenase
MKELKDIKNILIIGCGTLGLRIGLRCAIDGYTVRMYDISDKILEKTVATQEKLLSSFTKKGMITTEQAEGARERISTTTDIEKAVKNIDLVSESVTEDLELKKKVYQAFAPHFEKHTVVTTNTSYLLASMFAEDSGCAERFCAFHFHDVFFMNVVDIMPHPNTEGWVCDVLMAFGKSINQIPVYIKNENNGYIFNQMLMALLGSAGDLVTRNVSSIQDVDRSWMGNTKMHIGPYGMLDQIGLDTAWHIVSVRKDPKSMRFAELLKTFVDVGKLGVKSGEGFYTYPNPEYLRHDFI